MWGSSPSSHTHCGMWPSCWSSLKVGHSFSMASASRSCSSASGYDSQQIHDVYSLSSSQLRSSFWMSSAISCIVWYPKVAAHG